MGLNVSFYREAVDPDSWFPDGYDCSMNGESIRFPSCCVVNVPGPFEPGEKKPAMMLVDDAPCGKPYPKLVPAELVNGEWVRKPGWYMFGGNYAGTSDSRYSKAVEDCGGSRAGILPVFDRMEG